MGERILHERTIFVPNNGLGQTTYDVIFCLKGPNLTTYLVLGDHFWGRGLIFVRQVKPCEVVVVAYNIATC